MKFEITLKIEDVAGAPTQREIALALRHYFFYRNSSDFRNYLTGAKVVAKRKPE